MKEWRKAKVDGNFRKAFEIASNIANRFDDDTVRSAYVLFAAMNIPDTVISKTIYNTCGLMVPDLDSIETDREIFSRVFGDEAADRIFTNNEDNEAESTKSKVETTHRSERDKIAEVVVEVLDNIVDSMYPEPIALLDTKYSNKLENACEQAYAICLDAGKDYIDLDSLIYYILNDKESSAYKFMRGAFEEWQSEEEIFMEKLKKATNITCDVVEEIEIPPELASCLKVLNKKYKKGDEITILGRDEEIKAVFSNAAKMEKRNTMLLGRPGVGKTAIIEAVTQHIVNKTCPEEFIGYKVLELDVNDMLAGTKFRGTFEDKVSMLVRFMENTRNIIIFVDEMHQMLGAGDTSDGGVSLSESLKKSLARDVAVFVGATTSSEYNRMALRDDAFERRFCPVEVAEPKHHEVADIIESKLKKMEAYHGVKLPREYLDYIILCSTCFNPKRANPDKTLDLCDRSMAIAKMEKMPEVTMECINSVYNEYFKRYLKMSPSEVKSVAYHEAGHFVVAKLTKKINDMRIVAISIVPGNDFVGVNILEPTGNIVSCDNEYVEAYLMTLLAGRVAQFNATKSIDSGASSDIRKAKEFAKAVITEFGMDEGEFKNINLTDDELLNEKLTEAINEKVTVLINKANNKTKVFINEHWSEIDAIAKYLMEKKIVTSEELEQFIKHD